MFFEIAVGAFMLGQYVYHRWVEDEPRKPSPNRELTLPRTDEGAVYPLIYGRCKVNAPVMVWAGTPSLRTVGPGSGDALSIINVPASTLMYAGGMVFVMGVPFENGLNRMHNIHVGEVQMNNIGAGHFPTSGSSHYAELPELDGEGGLDDSLRKCRMSTAHFHAPYPDPSLDDDTNLWIQGYVEFLNGKDDQILVGGATPVTKAGQIMIYDGADPDLIPGYRNRMLATFYGFRSLDDFGPSGVGDGDSANGCDDNTSPVDQFTLGVSPNYPNFAFDCSSYPGGTGLGGSRTIGSEANPADVLYDLLTSPNKLGLPFARVDLVSFTAVAVALNDEAHGYSNAFCEPRAARDIIEEILRQIDAVIFEDPNDLLIKIKLVRGDYDVSTIPDINPTNCEKIENLALGGWANVVNKIRIVFKDRQERYADNSAISQNMANAVGQDGLVREVSITMPGVCTKALAETIAKRELSARSRPIMKCRVTVDRSLRGINPGDVVSVTHAEYNLAGLIFRVAGAERGTLEDGKVVLDLIQDFFYLHRAAVVSPFLPPFPSQTLRRD